jgi:hypothetical protein
MIGCHTVLSFKEMSSRIQIPRVFIRTEFERIMSRRIQSPNTMPAREKIRNDYDS